MSLFCLESIQTLNIFEMQIFRHNTGIYLQSSVLSVQQHRPMNVPYLKVLCENECQPPSKLLFYTSDSSQKHLKLYGSHLFILIPTFVHLSLLPGSCHTPELKENLEYGWMVTIANPLHKMGL